MSTAKPPVTDSPWFWACLFASAGLLVLWYFSGQYAERQLRIERQGQARMRAVEIATEGEPRTEVSMPGELQMPLAPIFIMLTALLCGAWAMFWWQRGRQRVATETTLQADSAHDVRKGAT